MAMDTRIAERRGISRTTVIKAVRSTDPPNCSRRSTETSFIMFETRIEKPARRSLGDRKPCCLLPPRNDLGLACQQGKDGIRTVCSSRALCEGRRSCRDAQGAGPSVRRLLPGLALTGPPGTQATLRAHVLQPGLQPHGQGASLLDQRLTSLS